MSGEHWEAFVVDEESSGFEADVPDVLCEPLLYWLSQCKSTFWSVNAAWN